MARRICGWLIVLAAALGVNAPAAAQEDVTVDLELVLAVDISGSMDADERQVQRDGYVQAFLHPGGSPEHHRPERQEQKN